LRFSTSSQFFFILVPRSAAVQSLDPDSQRGQLASRRILSKKVRYELFGSTLQSKEAGIKNNFRCGNHRTARNQRDCQEFTHIRGIPISYKGDESLNELSPGTALCIYRIAQEALGNVAKHAKAKQVEVRLTRSDDRVCLLISDDGVGFDSNRNEGSAGLGLINMRERVSQLNGSFEFESQPGRGTRVQVAVPFRPD
jgi:signal transduction histidine kinase